MEEDILNYLPTVMLCWTPCRLIDRQIDRYIDLINFDDLRLTTYIILPSKDVQTDLELKDHMQTDHELNKDL